MNSIHHSPTISSSPQVLDGASDGALVIENVAFRLFLVLVVCMPIPLGSNRPWAWSVLEIMVMSIFGLMLLSMVIRPRPWSDALAMAKLPLMMSGVWLVYLGLQSLPLPASLIRVLGPAGYDLYNYTSGSLATIPLALDRGAAQVELLKAASYVGICLLTLTLVTSRQRLKMLVWVLFLTGFAEAIYGLLAVNGVLLWNPTPGSVSGTYVNRNHLAGLLEMTLPLGLGLYWYRGRDRYVAPGWRQKLRDVSDTLLQRRFLVLVMTTLMFGVLLMTTSRGGVAALLFAGVVVGGFARIRNPHSHEARMLPVFLVMAFVSVTWFGIAGLTNKIAKQGIDELRIEVWGSSAKIIGRYPMFGVGGGAWKSIFPLYRVSAAGTGTFEHAHNDFLEIVAEQGLLGGLLLGMVLLLMSKHTLKALMARRDPFAVSIAFAILTAVLALLAHATVDFNFQIPANICYLIILISLGVVIGSQGSGQRQGKDIRKISQARGDGNA